MVRKWSVCFETVLKRWLWLLIYIISASTSKHTEPITTRRLIILKVAVCKAEYDVFMYITGSRGSLVENSVIGICGKKLNMAVIQGGKENK